MKSVAIIQKFVTLGLLSSLASTEIFLSSSSLLNHHHHLQGLFVSAFTITPPPPSHHHHQALFPKSSTTNQQIVSGTTTSPSLFQATHVTKQKRNPHQPATIKMSSSNDTPSPSKKSTTTPKTTTTSPSLLLEKTLFAIGKSTSSLVAITFFLILSYKRDAFMISFFIGAILNGILSKILKRLLNQDRPNELHLEENKIKLKPSDKGMPSSHAMSLGFIGTMTAMKMDLVYLSVGLVFYVFTSLYFRVKSNLHTTEQVLVGLGLGVTNAYCWQNLMVGSFPLLPSVHVMDMVETHILPSSGVLPWPYLIIPAVVGAAVVGSFERRISGWFQKGKED